MAMFNSYISFPDGMWRMFHCEHVPLIVLEHGMSQDFVPWVGSSRLIDLLSFPIRCILGVSPDDKRLLLRYQLRPSSSERGEGMAEAANTILFRGFP